MTRVVICPAGHDFLNMPPEPRQFWYFGTQYASYLDVTARLPAGWAVVDAGESINNAADQLIRLRADLESQLFDGLPPTDWWATSVSERNPYADDLYLTLSQAVVLVNAARRGGCHVVAVDDPALGRAMVATLQRNGISASWQGPRERPFGRTAAFTKATLAALRDGWKASRAVKKHRLNPELLGRRKVWLMTWIDGSSFISEGVVAKDGFFGDLPAWLRSWGIALGWLGNPTGWKESDDRIAASAALNVEPTALVGSFVGMAARIRAVACRLRLVGIRRRKFTALGLDLSAIIRRSIDRDIGSGVALRAIVYSEIGRQCRRLGIKPEVLIYTYENQPWEKQLLAGFRRYLPETRLIAFQHAVFADRYVSAEPTPAQLAAGLFPDIVMTSGEEFRERLIRCGVTAEKVVVGGALRLPHLAKSHPASPHTAITSMLATLPMQPDEALELAHKAALASATQENLRLLINFHPMMAEPARDAIRRRVAALDGGHHISFVEGNVGRWLGECDLLLYNSSGTVFEAGHLGIPAVYVGPVCGLDLEKLPGGSRLRCRSVSELVALIGELRGNPEKIAEAVRDAHAKGAKCFTAPRPEAWQDIVLRPVRPA